MFDDSLPILLLLLKYNIARYSVVLYIRIKNAPPRRRMYLCDHVLRTRRRRRSRWRRRRR